MPASPSELRTSTVRSTLCASSSSKLVTFNLESWRLDCCSQGSGVSPTSPAAPPAAPANATHGKLPFRLNPKRRSLNVAPFGAEMIRPFMHSGSTGSSSRSPRTCGAFWLQAPYLIPQNNTIINRNRRPARLATILELDSLVLPGSRDFSPAAAPPPRGLSQRSKTNGATELRGGHYGSTHARTGLIRQCGSVVHVAVFIASHAFQEQPSAAASEFKTATEARSHLLSQFKTASL